MVNFVSNALKYTKQGFIKLKIYPVEDPSFNSKKQLIRFSIQDSGLGIQKADQNGLFQLFGKVKDENNLNPDGVGLGLMICEKLIKAMNGDIGFNSKYQIGSEFWITLPLLQKLESSFNQTMSNDESLNLD